MAGFHLLQDKPTISVADMASLISEGAKLVSLLYQYRKTSTGQFSAYATFNILKLCDFGITVSYLTTNTLQIVWLW